MGPSSRQCCSCCCSPAKASLWRTLQVRLCGQSYLQKLMPLQYGACAANLGLLAFQLFCAACFVGSRLEGFSCPRGHVPSLVAMCLDCRGSAAEGPSRPGEDRPAEQGSAASHAQVLAAEKPALSLPASSQTAGHPPSKQGRLAESS
jgi:hypothetical protein